MKILHLKLHLSSKNSCPHKLSTGQEWNLVGSHGLSWSDSEWWSEDDLQWQVLFLSWWRSSLQVLWQTNITWIPATGIFFLNFNRTMLIHSAAVSRACYKTKYRLTDLFLIDNADWCHQHSTPTANGIYRIPLETSTTPCRDIWHMHYTLLLYV